VSHQRQLPDDFIRRLASRGGVIGLALDAWMIVPGWVRGQSTPESTGVSLQHVADHADHIAQVTGSAAHVGIGTDLDGAFGNEQTPREVKSIADIVQLGGILRGRGWSESDVAGVFSGNYLGFLRRAWKA
jgi:membrane dipeptidase